MARIRTKDTMRFVDWCPRKFQVGFKDEPPTW
jgi:hypothetical protein